MCGTCHMLDRMTRAELDRLVTTIEAPPRLRPAPRATRSGAGAKVLTAWAGWTPAVTLAELDAARVAARRNQPVSARLRPFLARGTPQIYRITRRGIDKARPLTIGMTELNKSIVQRVAQHHGDTKGGDPNVIRRLANISPERVLIQAARLIDPRMTIRRAHGYEIWLQDRERPLIHNQDTRTFDESCEHAA